MMKQKKTVGLIGYGSFGELIVSHLSGRFSFAIHTRGQSPENTSDVQFVPLKKAANQPIIILAIPLTAYKKAMEEISKHAPQNAVVVDVCSVKVAPFALARKHLRDDIEFIGTHPLFGPQSAAQSLKDHTLVFCNEKQSTLAHRMIALFEELGLKVVFMSASEHDQQMAEVHALTFFVARGLMKTGLHKNTLLTPSFQKMLDLAELETHHSESLFQTIEGGNPFAQSARQKLIAELKALNKSIKKIH